MGSRRSCDLRADDVLAGILPFFHSFGYTATLVDASDASVEGDLPPFTPRAEADRQAVPQPRRHDPDRHAHVSPLVRAADVEPEDFAKLDTVITGAEQLPVELADAFEKRFGIRPVEGYGTTELSPVVASTSRRAARPARPSIGCREGSVGRPLPGISAKVVDLDTGEDLGVDQSGMLLVTGPNVMKGYLDQPELTAEVVRDGWYVTGDVARIDADGFITITGRQSRFAKIGGEMVPLIHVEEEIARVLGLDQENVGLVVAAVPDVRKGERLVVLHTGLTQPPEEICRRLAEAGLKPLSIPSPDSFRQIDDIPLLGSGKLDLRRVREMAIEHSQTRQGP